MKRTHNLLLALGIGIFGGSWLALGQTTDLSEALSETSPEIAQAITTGFSQGESATQQAEALKSESAQLPKALAAAQKSVAKALTAAKTMPDNIITYAQFVNKQAGQALAQTYAKSLEILNFALGGATSLAENVSNFTKAEREKITPIVSGLLAKVSSIAVDTSNLIKEVTGGVSEQAQEIATDLKKKIAELQALRKTDQESINKLKEQNAPAPTRFRPEAERGMVEESPFSDFLSKIGHTLGQINSALRQFDYFIDSLEPEYS